MTQTNRTTQGLRDMLFDEIESVRGGGKPAQALAVAMLAKQIIATARVELEYHRAAQDYMERGRELAIGSMPLGRAALESAASADVNATAVTPDREQYPESGLHPQNGDGRANLAGIAAQHRSIPQ